MSIKPKDPLLAAGKVMTVLLMVLTGLVTVLLLGIIPFILFNQGNFAESIEITNAANLGSAIVATIALLLIASAITAMAFHFFRLLGRIIDTVSIDDPFTAENAQRLSHMGWIALIFQLASFPIAGLVVYLGDYVPSENLTVDYEFSLTGVLLAVVLFILARIFRHGEAMREDLEGTV